MQSILIVLLLGLISNHSDNEYEATMSFDDRANFIDKLVIYYGDTVRLEHISSEFFLHSHVVSYAQGS